MDEARATLGYTASGPVTEVYVTGGRADPTQPGSSTEVRLPYAG